MQLPKININEADLYEILKGYAVEELYLFGSILREDFTNESDVDILISFKKNSNYTLFALMDLREKFLLISEERNGTHFFTIIQSPLL